ncbi:hypothetical protein ABW19_dt0206298 [Dactylella cylindrospora]|nr:hypothetical protein ABW19_dt0206298 [Dactylella cylindrospora]
MPVSYSYESKSYESKTTPQGTSSRSVHTTPQGTTVTTTYQPAGGQPSSNTVNYPTGGTQGRIEGELTKEEADRMYEEAMEEEYAKREGGA